MSKKDWKRGRDNDSGETEGHIRPRRDGGPDAASVAVPEGQWVDVPKGYVAAAGTYVDDEGVLRSTGDHSCVVWHLPRCEKRGIQPNEIVYDPETNAPWCPKCWSNKVAIDTLKKIAKTN